MDARWYVIHVYSGFERKVAQLIEEQAKQAGDGASAFSTSWFRWKRWWRFGAARK